VDAGREATDCFRELWRPPRGFGDGTASWVVGQPAVYLASACREGRLGDEEAALVPVEIAAPAVDRPATIEERGHDAAFPRASKNSGLIVIEVGNGRRIRVDGDFDAEALGRVIDVLDRRR
jgi:hypothetical protein